MVDKLTNKGKLLLIKTWNENTKSPDKAVRDRAIEMLLGAFDTPQEMMLYFQENNIRVDF